MEVDDRFGTPPRLEWVPVDRLSVDESYQRSLATLRGERLIERIVEKFKWAAFKAILATTCIDVDGKPGWLIIDGQHRVAAARKLGIVEVPAIVIVGLTTAEQAALFVVANQQRVAVNPFALYHASVAGGDPSAVAIAEMCETLGIVVPRTAQNIKQVKSNQTLALNELKKIVEDDPRHGRRALRIIRAAWPTIGGGLAALIIRATRITIAVLPNLDDDHLKTILAARPPTGWTVEFRGGAGASGMSHNILGALRQRETARTIAMPGVDRARLMAGR